MCLVIGIGNTKKHYAFIQKDETEITSFYKLCVNHIKSLLQFSLVHAAQTSLKKEEESVFRPREVAATFLLYFNNYEVGKKVLIFFKHKFFLLETQI